MKYYDLVACEIEDGFSECPPVRSIKGGTEEQNRKAVRSNLPLLLDPIESGKMSIDSATLQIAKDRDVTIGITFRQFLKAGRFKRIRLLVSYRKLVRLCLRKGNRILLASGAETSIETRSPEQLVAFGVLLGMTRRQAKWSISKVPEHLGAKK